MAELIWRGKTQQQPERASEKLTPHMSVPHFQQNYQLTTLHYYSSPQQAPHQEDAWYNRLIKGDKNEVLPALLAQFAGAIKLIYIDPPFMTGRTFRTLNDKTQIAYKDTWKKDLDHYLQWLYETLSILYQLLAHDGSLYVHIDWRASHYIKIILDEIFQSHPPTTDGAGFKNEIIWHYQSGGRAQKHFARKHDTILLYTKSERYCFHSERVGERRGSQKRNHMRKEIQEDGRIVWTIRSNGRLYTYDENTTMSLADVWHDISHLHQKDPERTGYATQKPLALLERILLASSEEHDIVLDCFCGSGVTAVAAERLGRRWITCDKSDVAISVTTDRLLSQNRRHPFALQYVSCIEEASSC